MIRMINNITNENKVYKFLTVNSFLLKTMTSCKQTITNTNIYGLQSRCTDTNRFRDMTCKY